MRVKNPAARGAKAKVKVVVNNRGNVLAKGMINIPVYVSTDKSLDNGDRLVGAALSRKINLKAGKSATFVIRATILADLVPGDYYFLADVDPTNAIAESDETNNVAATSDPLTVQ